MLALGCDDVVSKPEKVLVLMELPFWWKKTETKEIKTIFSNSG